MVGNVATRTVHRPDVVATGFGVVADGEVVVVDLDAVDGATVVVVVPVARALEGASNKANATAPTAVSVVNFPE